MCRTTSIWNTRSTWPKHGLDFMNELLYATGAIASPESENNVLRNFRPYDSLNRHSPYGYTFLAQVRALRLVGGKSSVSVMLSMAGSPDIGEFHDYIMTLSSLDYNATRAAAREALESGSADRIIWGAKAMEIIAGRDDFDVIAPLVKSDSINDARVGSHLVR